MDSLTTDYIKHALKLIRVGNSMQADANAGIQLLARRLKKLFAGEDLSKLGIVKLRKLIAEADQLVFDSLSRIGQQSSEAAATLIKFESKWAKKIGQYDVAASNTAISRAISNFTVFGNTVDDHMAVISQRLSNQVEAQVRLGASAGQTDQQIIQRIIGTNGLGGVLAQASANARAIADATAHAAADTGRRAAMAASGVAGIQWMAKMDDAVCPDCAERDGKVWLIDGTPVGDAPEWIPVPIHPRCRCISMPLQGDSPQLEEYASKTPDNFGDWLDTLSEADQNDILGVGRAGIWRSGDMSLGDLVGQDGMMMSLAELKSILEND